MEQRQRACDLTGTFARREESVSQFQIEQLERKGGGGGGVESQQVALVSSLPVVYIPRFGCCCLFFVLVKCK